MHEVFPFMAGGLIGLLALRMASPWARVAVTVGLSLVLGAVASFISGELFVRWEFLLVDVPLVLVSALVTAVAVTRLQRSRTWWP